MTVQPKLTINTPGDRYEQEADAMADRVMRMPASEDKAKLVTGLIGGSVQRKCVSCKEEEKRNSIMRKESGALGGLSVSSSFASSLNASKGSGSPLPQATKSFMENAFSTDFSGVRIHADSHAAEMSRGINAKAFTYGRDIYFDQGKYAPENIEGKKLLAHELTHIIQQLLLIQRKPAAKLIKEDEEEKVELKQLKYVCVFVGYDLYGIQARRYLKIMMPDHYLIEASSMEDAMIKIRDNAKLFLKGGSAAHIAEVVLIAHGNASGFIKIPLIKGRRGITPEDIVQIQDEFKSGGLQKFQEVRSDVVSLFDNNTDVIIRGCRIGRNQETVDALAAFFGGHARVYAPKEYQAFTSRQLSSFNLDPKKAAINAFDHLVMQGFVPKEIIVSDDDKVRWVALNIPGKNIPESFFVNEENVDKIRHAGADDPSIQGLKDYLSSESIGSDNWGISSYSPPDDEDLDLMTAEELVNLAGEHLKKLRDIEANYPDNWRSIGEEAWWVLRCSEAWSRKPLSNKIFEHDYNGDPLGGMEYLTMPGLPADMIYLREQASKRPDLKTYQTDKFLDENLVKNTNPVNTEIEDISVDNKHKPLIQNSKDAFAKNRAIDDGKFFGSVGLENNFISEDSPMPTPNLNFDLDKISGNGPERTLVLRGEFKKPFEIKYERNLWLLKVKKVVVELNGKIDFKGDGEKELVLGLYGALSNKTGERIIGGGDKGEYTITKVEDKDTGLSGKLSGGIDLGSQSKTKDLDSSRLIGGKAEIYLIGQVAWGPLSQELKIVVLGYDETKSGADKLTIAGIKWSPIVTKAVIELPVSDGTKVKFDGTVKITIEAVPDWIKIIAKISESVGREVIVKDSVLIAGGANAGAMETGTFIAEDALASETMETGIFIGESALAGETIIMGGFVAGGVLAIYSYYKSIEEIEDFKELKRGANQGCEDFCGGYLAYLGILSSGKSEGMLWKEGQRHAELNFHGRVKKAIPIINQKFKNILDRAENDFQVKKIGLKKIEQYRKEMKPLTEESMEVMEAIRSGILSDANSWKQAVYFSYETAVRSYFYYTWLKRTGNLRQAYLARAYAGISGVEPNIEPDYSWVNAVGKNGSKGWRPPTNKR